MGNVPPNQLEAGRAALRTLKLVERVRGQSVSPWRRLAAERIGMVLAVAGALLLWDQLDSWPAVLGVLLIAAGVAGPQDRTPARFDALVEYLESTGQLQSGGDRRRADASV